MYNGKPLSSSSYLRSAIAARESRLKRRLRPKTPPRRGIYMHMYVYVSVYIYVHI